MVMEFKPRGRKRPTIKAGSAVEKGLIVRLRLLE